MIEESVFALFYIFLSISIKKKKGRNYIQVIVLKTQLHEIIPRLLSQDRLFIVDCRS